MQAFTQRPQQRPIGLTALADALAQRVGAALHGKICLQLLNIAQHQVCCHPAREQQHLARYFGRDVWIAVAITTHPCSEADRHAADGQFRQPSLGERGIQFAHAAGDGEPQRTLDDSKA